MSGLPFWVRAMGFVESRLCPQCDALQLISELETDPSTKHGFTQDQIEELNLWLAMINEPDRARGRMEMTNDGQKIRFHACGKVVEFTPFIRGRLNGLAATAVERGAPVTEAYGLVDGSDGTPCP